MKSKFGKVLWWSEKDKNGIIIDSDGREFYFDISVINQNIKRNDFVTFRHNKNISDCLCATMVKKTKQVGENENSNN